MAKIFENSKHYNVIVLSPKEMQRWRRAAVCDRCGCRTAATGFYVGAYNLFYCEDCYAEWSAAAQTKEDRIIPQEREYMNRAIAMIVRLNVSTSFFFGTPITN